MPKAKPPLTAIHTPSGSTTVPGNRQEIMFAISDAEKVNSEWIVFHVGSAEKEVIIRHSQIDRLVQVR